MLFESLWFLEISDIEKWFSNQINFNMTAKFCCHYIIGYRHIFSYFCSERGMNFVVLYIWKVHIIFYFSLNFDVLFVKFMELRDAGIVSTDFLYLYLWLGASPNFRGSPIKYGSCNIAEKLLKVTIYINIHQWPNNTSLE